MLLWRAVYLQVLNKDFLQKQGDDRHLRVAIEVAHRGMIEDRNGIELASKRLKWDHKKSEIENLALEENVNAWNSLLALVEQANKNMS